MVTGVDIDEFSFPLKPGKYSYFLRISHEEIDEAGIPLCVANGVRPGKTLVAIAGVHGDELEGVQAIQDVFRRIEPEGMSGRLIAVPVANMPAYRAVTRTSPVDGLNLARVFPGRRDGTLSERTAFHLSEVIVPQADLFVDLHSSGVAYLMPQMTGYDSSGTTAGRASMEAAMIFGTPVVWGHERIGPGRTISSAAERGIPWLYVESPSGGRVSATYLPYYIDGLLNLLGHLKIIERGTPEYRPATRLSGPGDVDLSQAVRSRGFFVPKVRLLDRVEKGRVVGEVRDEFGDTVEIVKAAESGRVAMLRATPVVEPETPVCLVAQEESAP